MGKKVTGPAMKELIKVAEEFNSPECMDLDPALKTTGKIKKDDLIEEIKKVALLLEPQDKLTDETKATLTALGIGFPGSEETETPEETTEEETEETAEETETVKETKKTTGTRPEVFAKIMNEGGGTTKEIIAKMNSLYSGSEAEAKFQTASYLRVLAALEYVEKNEDGKYSLTK